LKNELALGLDVNAKLTDEKRTLETTLNLLRDEKRKLSNNVENVHNDVTALSFKVGELEKIIKELERERANLDR